MAYDATFHKSGRALEEEGPPFVYTAERRARFDEIVKRYPPDRKRSAVLPALYLVQQQQGYVTANGIRHVAELLGITRADVEDVVSRSEEHTSELQSPDHLVCRLLLEKKKNNTTACLSHGDTH